MKQVPMTDALYQYLIEHSLREHPTLKRLREVTATMDLALMQVPPEQAQFMQLLLRLIQAKKVLELGTFTGYSALALSLALPDEGQLITCDISAEWTRNNHIFWKEAGQEDKITLRLGPAVDTLEALIQEGYLGQFDFIFIDADKTNYCRYYELALKLLQPQGLIAIDNVLWEGKVIDFDEQGGQTKEIRRLNERIKNDPSVFVSLLPIADGLTLIQPLASQAIRL